MVIWKDIDVKVNRKIWHIHKIGKKLHRDFTNTFGDIPVGNINEITNNFEPCINLRGRAYATRNRKKYLKKKGD